MIKSIYIVILSVLFSVYTSAQNNTNGKLTTFGLQLSPLLPTRFLEGGDVTSFSDDNLLQTTIGQKAGFSFGMVVRHNFTDLFALETAIKYTIRNYSLSASYDNLLNTDFLSEQDDFSMVGFEIPVKFLVYVRLSKMLYMNVATGLSIDAFPSDLRTSGQNYKQYVLVSPRFNFGALLDLGIEMRTQKSGYFYLGTSFHRPFADIGESRIVFYNSNGKENDTFTNLNGNYISIDFKYFFNENKKYKKVRE